MPFCDPHWDRGVSEWCNRQAMVGSVVTAGEMEGHGLTPPYEAVRAPAYRFGFLENGQAYYMAEPAP